MSEDTSDEPMATVFVPPLVTILQVAEQKKGAPLTESEVLAIRDKAPCIAISRSDAKQLFERRGHGDLDPENAWEQWQAVRKTL